jgi:hypothetical protein
MRLPPLHVTESAAQNACSGPEIPSRFKRPGREGTDPTTHYDAKIRWIPTAQSPGGMVSLRWYSAISVPAGEALVITDSQWYAQASTGPGTYAWITLFETNPLTNLAVFPALVDALGFFAGQFHLTTGLVVRPGSSVIAGSPETQQPDQFVYLQGYLVPNQ